jgi:uncharacterized protein
MSGATLPAVMLLAVIGLVGGIGITAVGPGGVLPTIGLFALTGLSPAQLAGTAIVTHVATGALGTAAYTRSGQLREPAVRRIGLILAGTALVGTPIGVIVGTAVSRHVFALVLGGVVAASAALAWHRTRRPHAEPAIYPPSMHVIALGLMVSAASGMLGIGGPMLSVPLLAAVGLPILQSLACAQAESIVIAAVGTLGYLVHGTIDWSLAAIVGLPELVGVLVGWKIAHALPTRALRNTLITTLCVVALYLVLHG